MICIPRYYDRDCFAVLAMTPDMDVLRPSVLRDLCTRAGIRPSRAVGQHFLINRTTRDRIIAAVDPQPSDTIVEVGAGFGVLTAVLAASGARIIAIERDRRIVPILRELVAPYGHVEVVEGDVLNELRAFGPKSRRAGGSRWYALRPSSPTILKPSWKLVANLPYGITSDFLRLLFDRIADGSLPTPERVVLLLQREVVDRLIGRPDARGFLTILAQLQCSPRRVVRVPPSHFWPAPKVESAVVALTDWRTPGATAAFLGVDRSAFLRLVHDVFVGRRQQIGTRLRSLVHDRTRVEAVCRAAGVQPMRRPETLDMTEWIALARVLGNA